MKHDLPKQSSVSSRAQIKEVCWQNGFLLDQIQKLMTKFKCSHNLSCAFLGPPIFLNVPCFAFRNKNAPRDNPWRFRIFPAEESNTRIVRHRRTECDTIAIASPIISLLSQIGKLSLIVVTQIKAWFSGTFFWGYFDVYYATFELVSLWMKT